MKLTKKQIETLVVMVEGMELNFSLFDEFETAACEDDFFNWANEDDIRGMFSGKTVSGRMSSLMKKGILNKEYVYDTCWVRVRRMMVLKQVAQPLWTFRSKEVFAKALGIQKGESVMDALTRLKAAI